MSDTLPATTPVPRSGQKTAKETALADPRAVAGLVTAAKAAYAYLGVYAQLPKDRYLPGEAAAMLALRHAIAVAEGQVPEELAPGETFETLLADAWAGLAREGRTPNRWDDEGIDHSDDPPGYDATRPWQTFGRADEPAKT
ncbi:MAG: hypothetical protein ACRDI2_24690 [Chloroflexota bacterium]